MASLMRIRWGIVGVIATTILAVTLPEAGVAQATAISLPPVRVEVSGDPTPIDTLHLAIVTTARAVVPEARGDQVELTQIAPPLALLPAASETAIRAVAQISAPYFRLTTCPLPVEIVHTVLPWSDAQALLVSNPTRQGIAVWVTGTNPHSGSDELVLNHRVARGGSGRRGIRVTNL